MTPDQAIQFLVDTVGFERAKRENILNVKALYRRMRGCDAAQAASGPCSLT